MANTIFVGDVGTRIQLDCGEDLTTATSLKIRYQKPSGQTGEWNATLDTDPTKIFYVTQTGDLDENGNWKAQAFVTLPAWSGSGKIDVFSVYSGL